MDLEELQLRQKLHEMTDNISDHSLTSDDDDESSGPPSSQENQEGRSPEGNVRPSKIPLRVTPSSSMVVSGLEELQQTDPEKVDSSVYS